jgi:parallel beta-helix repeat protein
MQSVPRALMVSVFLVSATAAPVAAGPSFQGLVIDQVAEAPGELYRFQHDYDSANYNGLAQTVTVGTDGLLAAVDLYLAREEWTTADLVFEIHMGEPSGWLLAISDPVPASAILESDTAGQWEHVTFPTPAVVRVGDVVAITVQIPDPLPMEGPAGPAWYWAWSDAGEPEADDYAGGAAWGGSASESDGSLTWGDPWLDGSDLAFRSWVLPRQLPPVETLTLTESTTLTADHYGNIVLAANDITLDCAGHAVLGPGDPVLSGGLNVADVDGVIIKRCVVSGFQDHGLWVGQSSRLRAVGNTFVGNGADGVHLESVTHGLLAGNTASGNFAGFLIAGSTATTLSDNRATANVEGIDVQGSQDVALTRNRVSDSAWAGLIVIDSTGTVGTSNVLVDNGGGLELHGSSGNLFVSNRISQTRDAPGIQLNEGSSANTFRNNTSVQNQCAGIAILGGSDDNRFIGNTANANGGNGFALYAADGNTLTGNTANGNGTAGGEGSGIDVADGSDDNTIADNMVNGNEDGIRVFSESNRNTVSGNTANSNHSYGIDLYWNASGNQVTRNTANHNMSFGLAAQWGAVGNSFTYNVALSTIDGSDIWAEEPGLNTWDQNTYKTYCTGEDC